MPFVIVKLTCKLRHVSRDALFLTGNVRVCSERLRLWLGQVQILSRSIKLYLTYCALLGVQEIVVQPT
jgi:hypothetical protein